MIWEGSLNWILWWKSLLLSISGIFPTGHRLDWLNFKVLLANSLLPRGVSFLREWNKLLKKSSNKKYTTHTHTQEIYKGHLHSGLIIWFKAQPADSFISSLFCNWANGLIVQDSLGPWFSQILSEINNLCLFYRENNGIQEVKVFAQIMQTSLGLLITSLKVLFEIICNDIFLNNLKWLYISSTYDPKFLVEKVGGRVIRPFTKRLPSSWPSLY